MKYRALVSFLSFCICTFPAAILAGCGSSAADSWDQEFTQSSDNGVVTPGTPPSDSTPPSGSDNPAELDAEEQAFLNLINRYRIQNGVPALVISPSLTAAAKWLSEDMATKSYLSHTDSTGRSFSIRVKSWYSASSTIGENIAYGNATAQGTFEQWRNSPGHNQNMLSASYKAIGIGRFNYNGTSWGWYWTTDFGGRED